MTDCKWVASDQPRVLPGRHAYGCGDEECAGCQPCTEPHCRICGLAHDDGACAECLAETRDALRQIGRMCDALPEEVEHRGINGEAMVLLGPVADNEARGHLEASVAVGRVPADWLDVADNERHPLFVLGGWRMVWADVIEDDNEDRLNLGDTVEYLDRNLYRMSRDEMLPFDEFARDLRKCRTHLEAVLHDGEQVDRGAPCMECHVSLERTWGKDEAADGWRCPRCRRTSTDAQYHFAVAQLHREEATHLTDRDMQIRTGVKAGTVRVWAQRGQVERKRDAGRTLYRVADVEAVAKAAGMAS